MKIQSDQFYESREAREDHYATAVAVLMKRDTDDGRRRLAGLRAARFSGLLYRVTRITISVSLGPGESVAKLSPGFPPSDREPFPPSGREPIMVSAPPGTEWVIHNTSVTAGGRRIYGALGISGGAGQLRSDLVDEIVVTRGSSTRVMHVPTRLPEEAKITHVDLSRLQNPWELADLRFTFDACLYPAIDPTPL